MSNTLADFLLLAPLYDPKKSYRLFGLKLYLEKHSSITIWGKYKEDKNFILYFKYLNYDSNWLISHGDGKWTKCTDEYLINEIYCLDNLNYVGIDSGHI